MKFPPQKIVSKRLIDKPALVVVSPSHKNTPSFHTNDHYYAQTNYKLTKAEAIDNRQTRDRVTTQVPYFGKGVEYVGAENN